MYRQTDTEKERNNRGIKRFGGPDEEAKPDVFVHPAEAVVLVIADQLHSPVDSAGG